MPTNQYLPFAASVNTSVVSQGDYAAAEWRADGWRSGILPHQQINKVLRQTSVVTAGLMQAIGTILNADTLDDGSVTGVANKILTGFSAYLPYDPNTSYPPGSIGNAINTLGGLNLTADGIRAILVGSLTEDELTTGLRNRINLIDAPTTGLVTKVDDLITIYGSTASAASSAAAAAQSLADAVAAANAAAVSAGAAFTSETNANSHRVAAGTSASGASSSAAAAATSASSAAGSATSASNSATAAANSATAAGNSATAAATSASNAATSATAAGTSATAANTSATNASTSASNASSSATQAANSATAAAGSASSASTQALNAANSASAAAGSASAASGSASSAATSATNAATSATAATTARNAAQTAASAASTSQSAAATSATNAAGSASSASSSATVASTAATNAGNSATAANTSASSASTSASNAANSATAAAEHYNNTVASTGALTAQVNTLASTTASQIAGIHAQYVLKVAATRSDGLKVFGAIALAATAPTDGTGGQSQIILQADKLIFVPSSNPNAPLTQAFVVGQVNGVTTLVVSAAVIGDATITPTKLSVPNLSAISANVGTLTAGTIRNVSDSYRLDVTEGREIVRSGGFMKVTGAPFGSSNQFIEWYGPYQANLSNCTEANAIYYLKTNGAAYFGGTLSAGVLQNSARTTSVSPSAEVIVGPFLTNGGTKAIVISYSYFYRYACASGTGSISGPAGNATVVLERSINGGTWTQIGTLSANETVRTVITDDPDTVIFRIDGSTTVNDNSAATANMRLRARLTSRSLPSFGGSGSFSFIETQEIGVISTEQP